MRSFQKKDKKNREEKDAGMEGFERTGRKIVVVSQCRCSFYHEANCRGHTECIEAGSGHGLLLYVSVLLFVLKTNDRFWQKKRLFSNNKQER